MLLDDERPPERDHHQDAEQAAQAAHEHHAGDPDAQQMKEGLIEVVPEDHQGGHRDADPEGDRLAGRAGGLDDVVLKNRPVPLPKARNSAIESTATGIDAETVIPTFKDR